MSKLSESRDDQVEDDAMGQRLKRLLIGPPRDIGDRRVFTHLSLIAFLAWVGLGADGLSSSCYGPAEAFHSLGEHRYLAVALAAATLATVFIISACYSHIIEEFPSGGGGYLVASKLLGARWGAVSGCALLVDYVLTVTTSIAAAGNALFGFLKPDFALLGLSADQTRLFAEAAAIVLLIVLNLRGVKESVKILVPIFITFLVTHAILIAGTIVLHIGESGEQVQHVTTGIQTGLSDPSFGIGGMLALLLYAYSLGAGTYTGIEADSNSMPVLREPRVYTAKRTMRYMAWSLAITAGGLMIVYLLLDVHDLLAIPGNENKTMNHVIAEAFVR